MQGKNLVRQITTKGRFARALKSVHEWCKTNRHLPVEAQHGYLVRAIRSHYAYYGLKGMAGVSSGSATKSLALGENGSHAAAAAGV